MIYFLLYCILYILIFIPIPVAVVYEAFRVKLNNFIFFYLNKKILLFLIKEK